MSEAPSCPVCKKAVAARAENEAFPFCSVRCRTIDLADWLDERHRIAERSTDEDAEPFTPGENS